MAIRVSKTALAIVSVIAFLVLAGIGGYVAWRISQEREVTPEESEAANNCCDDPTWAPDGCSGDAEWQAGYFACQRKECELCSGGQACSALGQSCAHDSDCCSDLLCVDGKCKDEGEGTPDACVNDPEICTGDESTCATHAGSGCVWCPDTSSCECVSCPEPPSPPAESFSCETCLETGICNWCSEGGVVREDCRCSDFNDDEGECWTHAGSGCWYLDGKCLCGGQTTDPDCEVTGSGGGSSCSVTVSGCGSVNVSVARCRESFSTLAQYNAATNNGTVCLVGCSSQTETLTEGTHSIGLTEPQCGRWQLDVSYAGGTLCSGSGCNWIPEVCELEKDEPYCGDGILDAGEECELGDPTGSSCSWSGECDQSTCSCPAVLTEYIQVSGEVYCQDDNDERFPVQGAEIYFYKTSDPGASENLATSASGSFVSAANTTQTTDGPFAVRYSGLADPSRTLSNGTSYSQMTGPVLKSPDVCTADRCDTCGASYEQCSGLTDPITYSGFDWVFANCSQELPNPDWDIEKEGSVVCYEDGKVNAYGEASYVITVTNIAEGGTVLYVTDEFDEAIDESWITSTTPTATSIEDGMITWTLSGSDGEFTEGESMEFRYTVRIPQSLFDEELSNHSIARLSTGEDLHAYEDIFVTCGLPGDETVPGQGPLPETGLLDSAVGRVAIGSVLVVMAYAYYKFGLVDTAMEWISGSAGMLAGKVTYALGNDGKKERWEKRMVKDIDKRRKRG